MKPLTLLLLLIVISLSLAGQTVILQVDRSNEPRFPDRGPNLKKFTHLILRAGFLVSKDHPGARIVYGTSVNLAFGLRNKIKISPVYSMGFDFENQYTDYKIRQEEGKVFPDTVLNNISGRLDYSSLAIGYYNRVNFDPRRGNFLGTFLDIGIMGAWDFSIKSISKNKQQDGTILKNVVRRLLYVNNLNAKVYARLGLSHVSLYGSYRLTKLFKSSWDYPDLPRVVVGIELAAF